MNFNVKFSRIDTLDYVENYCFKEEIEKLCQGCSNYNTNYSCPPFANRLVEEFKTYKYTHLIGAKIDLDPEEVAMLQTLEEKFVYGRGILHASRELLDEKLLRMEEKYPDSKSFFAGSCIRCDECMRLYNEPCPTPAVVRPCLEAVGFDIGRTAKDLLEIDMIWSDDYVPNYYSLICCFCTNVAIEGFADTFVSI